MKSVNLQRTVEVRCWRVIGQVAKAAKRAELMPVLLRARERGETDAGDVAGHLLFESSSRRVVAQRLLQIAELYGLLKQTDRLYRLTESGQAALATKQVFVPEHGTWKVWASDDPLLDTPIVRIERWSEPSVFDEARKENREDFEKRRSRICSLPNWVRPASKANRKVLLPDQSDNRWRVEDLEDKCDPIDPVGSLQLIWAVTAGTLRLEGKLNGSAVSTSLKAPSISTADVWRQLLESVGLWRQWDSDSNALRVAFADTSEAERESMERVLSFRRPEVRELGQFDATSVNGVRLLAQSNRDAQDWAKWRLETRIQHYATAERFSEWTAEAVAPFSEFHPSTPTRQALADAAWRDRTDRPTPSAWHLVAAEDWRL